MFGFLLCAFGTFFRPQAFQIEKNEGQKMTDTYERVGRITKELRALSIQFHWGAFENASPNDQAQVLNGLLNGSLVEDLRTTVDYLSQFLWSYIESAAESRPEADHAACELQNERLLRITEMLRLLHRSSSPSQDPLAFMDRVTKSVDRYLETTSEDDLVCEHRADDSGRPQVEEGPRHRRKCTGDTGGGRLFDSWR
jgi:hypothetical protein